MLANCVKLEWVHSSTEGFWGFFEDSPVNGVISRTGFSSGLDYNGALQSTIGRELTWLAHVQRVSFLFLQKLKPNAIVGAIWTQEKCTHKGWTFRFPILSAFKLSPIQSAYLNISSLMASTLTSTDTVWFLLHPPRTRGRCGWSHASLRLLPAGNYRIMGRFYEGLWFLAHDLGRQMEVCSFACHLHRLDNHLGIFSRSHNKVHRKLEESYANTTQ